MSKIKVLEWEDSLEVSILGVYSHLPDFRLAHRFNKAQNFSFESVLGDFTARRKEALFSFSLFRSPGRHNIAPVYLVDNKSFRNNEGVKLDNFMFQEGSTQVPLLASLKKWPFLLLSEDSSNISAFTELRLHKYISYIQSVDFITLKKSEQSILTSIIYDEQH